MTTTVTEFPIRPFDGMKFVDAFRRQWIYSTDTNTWVFDGYVPNIPLADSATVGLLSSKLKSLLDAIPSKAGGFGILTKHSFGKVSSDGFNGVKTGDIVLKSNSLDIKCRDANGNLITSSTENVPYSPELSQTPSIDINFKSEFLDTLCVEVPGGKGPDGPKGKKGPPGKDGTGDGPKGLQGDPGVDATGFSEVSEIIVEYDDAYYDTAVVDLKLDSTNSILEVTKGKLKVPTSDDPADQVVALPIGRSIEWLNSNTFDYKIVKTDDDALVDDVIVFAYPADFDPNTRETNANAQPTDTEITKTNFSVFIDKTIIEYQNKIDEYTKEYDKEVRDYILKKDDEARKALDQLVKELADLEFSDGFDYCMGMEDNGDCGNQVAQELHELRVDTFNTKIEGSLNDIANALNGGQEDTNIVSAINDVEDAIRDGGLPVTAQGVDVGEIQLGEVNQEIQEMIKSQVIEDGVNKMDIPIISTPLIPFLPSVCVYATAILENNSYSSTEASAFCGDVNSDKVDDLVIKPGDKLFVNTKIGPFLQAGAYFVQYKRGAIYDGTRPDCGYIVGSNSVDYGLVINIEDGSNLIRIPLPMSSGITNKSDLSNVEQAYLTGPITEYITGGIIINNGGRIYIESVVGDISKCHGDISLVVWYCARCTE